MSARTFHWVIGLGLVSAAAYAAVTAYQSDKQRYYNRDAAQNATDMIGTLSCILNQTGVAQENDLSSPQKSYAVWVDEDGCRAGTSTTDTQVDLQKYWVVQEEVGEALIVKWWEYGDRTTYAKAEISKGISDQNPNGVWKVDWCVSYLPEEMPGKSGDEACFQRGHAELTADNKYRLYYKRLSSGDINSYSKVSSGTVSEDQESGYGAFSETLSSGKTNEGYFGFAEGALKQSYNLATVCKNPTATTDQALHQIWNGWLYDPTTEKRITSSTGPFAVKRVSDGEVAWASHEGVRLPGSSNSESTGSYVRVEGADKSSLTAYKSYGKLIKREITRLPNGLHDIDKLRLRFKIYKDAFPTLATNSDSTYDRQYVMGYWDDAASSFVFTGADKSSSGLTGKDFEAYDTPVRFQLAEFLTQAQSTTRQWARSWWTWLPGSSQEYYLNLADADPNKRPAPLLEKPVVYRFDQSTVVPGSADAPQQEFVCLGKCPRPDGAGGVELVENYNLPKAELEALPTYVFDANGHLTVDGLDIDEALIERNGLDSHRKDLWLDHFVLKSELGRLSCYNDTQYCAFDTKAPDAETIGETTGNLALSADYAWNTGPYRWNRFAGLKRGDGTFVEIDQPKTLFYDVPDDPTYGALAGFKVAMQSPGNGKLWFPSHCVNITNASARTTRDCSGTNETYINDFIIPFDKTLGKVSDLQGEEYLVKWLRQGVYYPDHSDSTACDTAKVAGMFNEGAALDLPDETLWVNPRDNLGDIPANADPSNPRYVQGMPTY